MSDPPVDNRPPRFEASQLEVVATAELMRLHRSSLYELYRRGIIRTLNAPQGDWAELLVATAYQGHGA